MSDAPAQDRFRVVRPLGSGAAGDVVLAEDRLAGREVALKRLSAARAGDPEARLALRAEFATLRRLAHPRLVAALDWGEDPDGTPWFTMAPVLGATLDACVPAAHEQVRAWLIGLLEGLAALHARGWVHADMSLANVRLDQAGEPVLMDLGLAMRVGEAAGAPRGTPLYMAPEVIRGDRLDGRADLYALGALAFHLLAGRPPFDAAEGPGALLRAHLQTQPPPLDAAAPPDLAALIGRMLAKAPAARPATAEAALAMLGRDPGEPPARLVVPGLVGREALLQAAEKALAAAREAAEPARAWLTVQGPPGAGRTRILEELGARARLSGAAVVRVGGMAGRPGQPFAAAGRLAAALAPLAPEAAAAFADRLARPTTADGAAAWLAELRASFRALVAAAALDAPLLLALDDWEAADAGSRELVDALAGLNVAIAATGGLAGAASHALEPLDAAAIGRLAGDALGAGPLLPPDAEALRRAAGGNPGLALAMVEALRAAGGLRREGDTWRLPADLGAARLPADLAAAAMARLAELPDEALALARVLARATGSLAASQAAAVAGVPAAAVPGAIAALRERGLLAPADGGLALAPGPHGAALREGTPADVAAAIEGALAAHLEPAAHDRPELAPAVAGHWRRAGDPVRARPWALTGARWLLARRAAAEARTLLEPVLADAGTPDEERLMALELAGDAARALADGTAAEAWYAEALARREAGGLAGKARLRTSLALLEQQRGRPERARALAEQAATEAGDDARERARALTTQARAALQLGDRPGAAAAAAAAVETARLAGDEDFEAEALALSGYLLTAEPTREHEGLALLERSCRMREAAGDRLGLSDTLMFLGNAHLEHGRHVEAAAAFAANAALGRELGVAPDDEATARLNLALTALALDDLGTAEAEATAAARLAGRASNAFLGGYAEALRDVVRQRAEAAARPVPRAASAAESGMGEVIADFGKLVMGALSHQQALERALERAMAITGADRGMILLVGPDGGLEGLIVRPVSEDGLVSFSRTFVETALRERRPVWVADAQADERFAAARSVMAMDLRTLVCVPLIAEDALIGALYLDQRSVARPFDAADLALVEGLAGFAALAIANARRHEEAAERERILTALHELGRMADAEETDLAPTLLGRALRVARAAAGVLGKGAVPTPEVGLDREGRVIAPVWDEAAVSAACATGEPRLVLDAGDGEVGLAVPLEAGGRLVGALWLRRPEAEGGFGPADLELIEAVAAQAARTLARAAERAATARRIATLESRLRLLEDQRDAGNMDAATGLFAGGYFERRLGEAVAEARRYGRPLALLVLRAGGLAGLATAVGEAAAAGLRAHLGELLGAQARQADLLARLDEELFAYLLPETEDEGVEAFSARLAELLADLAVCDAAGNERWRLDARLAFATWQELEAPEAFLARALARL